MTELKPALNGDDLPLMIFVNKGIEIGTKALTLDIIIETCGPQIAKAATFIVSVNEQSICRLIVILYSLARRLRKRVSVISLDWDFEANNICQLSADNRLRCLFVPCQRTLQSKRHNCSINRGSGGTNSQNFSYDICLVITASYTGDDPIGVELAGAMKNVYAIASGMADGLGFENNTRASKLCFTHRDVLTAHK